MAKVTVALEIPPVIAKVVEELIKAGDYRDIDDFFAEAARSHLNTWYPKTLAKISGLEKEAKEATP